MQCFRLPEAVCADIDRICAGFWWGDKEEGRKLHWAKWSVMCWPKDRGGMGFRDIRSFNRALLAKQVWRMLTNPGTLVARVFRARYFKDENLMSAEVKSNASFVWRSLAWSRKVVEDGKGWNVGDGRNISVWTDRWVAGLQGSLLEYGERTEARGLKVIELIKQGAAWDETRLDSMFSPIAKAAILNTPIGERGSCDEVRWRFDPKGIFSVKSAYLLEIGYYEANPNTSEPDKKLWSRMVWNISIPPKARIFLWRAFMNFIPAPANLKRHHVPTDGICALCGDRWGSTEHCLLHCPRVGRIWRESRFAEVVRRGQGLLLLDVAQAIIEECGEDEYVLWGMMLWQVWGLVCKLLHPEGEQPASTSEETCVIMGEEYQRARPTIVMENKLGVVLGDKSWRRPRRGRFRVDVDALFNPNALAFGVGIVVRNPAGDMVVAASRRTSPSSSVMLAEIMAVVHGIVLCLEHKVAPVEIYTDSFLAACVMANPEEEDSLLPSDICDILKVARENMLIGVFHMYRSANLVAHSLAQLALTSSRSECWTGDYPSWLRDIALEDVS